MASIWGYQVLKHSEKNSESPRVVFFRTPVGLRSMFKGGGGATVAGGRLDMGWSSQKETSTVKKMLCKEKPTKIV